MHHWRRDRVVARMRHLAEQNRIWRRAAAHRFHTQYVPWTFRSRRPIVLPSNPPNVLVIIGYRAPQVAPTTGIAILATDNIYVKAAGTVSLATHALATVLIAYKAWCVLRGAVRFGTSLMVRGPSGAARSN